MPYEQIIEPSFFSRWLSILLGRKFVAIVSLVISIFAIYHPVYSSDSYFPCPFFDEKRSAKSGAWGYLDNKGKVVIKPKYIEANHFREGLALVLLKNYEYRFIDIHGKTVIVAKYDDVRDFVNGMAAVNQNGKWGFINTAGVMVIKARYDNIKDFSEELAAVKVNGKWGYIDKKGRVVISPMFESSDDFREGLAAVKQNGKWGFIDKTGKLVIKMRFSRSVRFSEGVAVVRDTEGIVIIDKSGSELNRLEVDVGDKVPQFKDGLLLIKVNNKFGFIDIKGQMVIKPTYVFAWNFSDGLAPVQKDLNGYVEYINKTGHTVIKTNINMTAAGWAAPFRSDGFAKICSESERVGYTGCGIIDRQGRIVIEPRFIMSN